MSEIKPVYQVQQLGEWIEVDKSIFDELYIQNKFPHRILYPTAAYEALQKENADLKSEDEISAAVIEKCCNLLAQIAITLKGETEELARHGYHDLPELVAVLHLENELNKVQMQEMLTAMRRAVLALAFAAETSNAMKDDYNALSAAIAKAAPEYQELKTYCLGYTHDKCKSCLHDANWHALNEMPDSDRLEWQKNMTRINSDKCRMTSMGEYAPVEKYQEPTKDE